MITNTPPLIPSISLAGQRTVELPVSLLTTDAWLRSRRDPAIAHALITLMITSITQTPASSLPSDDELLQALSTLDSEAWLRVRDVVLAQFVLCSDDRYYHADVAAFAVQEDEARARKKAVSEMNAEKGRPSAARRALFSPANPALPLTATSATEQSAVAIKKVSTRNTNSTEVAEKKPSDALELFNFWRDTMKSPRAKFLPSREQLIKKWLKIYSLDDLKEAVMGCSQRPHNMGQNDRNTLFNGIELILRDGAHIEEYQKTARKDVENFRGVTSGFSVKAKKSFDAISRALMIDAGDANE